ncbi:MAG: hypothetical protein ACJ76H_14945 [Bacteriovoracaceae bacterium]
MKTIFFLLTIFSSSLALACPYCAGSSQGGKDNMTTIVLAGFVLSIYFPYVIIYRLIKKQKALKAAHDSSGPA